MPLSRFPVAILLLLLSAASGCSDRGGQPETRTETQPETRTETQPETRTETIAIEGMQEPIALRLFRPPDDFPLDFTAYVPEDMEPQAGPGDRAVRIAAEFGGVRNERAHVHVYVYPEGTPFQEAVALARGYTAGRSGIPVGHGIEPVTDESPPPEQAWAAESFRFRYQDDGDWYTGTLGVGRESGRHVMIVRHYPIEYADGFGPRADLIIETWRWADGSRLRASEEAGAER